ncbi:FKBP-type peptidyl-prolyl cis-trans isomerase, partial [Streptococcus danieliae]|nr:FKBP-type peptidyl-prolyl cis-trans isomerase [Streptococcus danieliae]
MTRSSVLFALICSVAASLAQAQVPAPVPASAVSLSPGPVADKLIVIDNKVGTGKEASAGNNVT